MRIKNYLKKSYFVGITFSVLFSILVVSLATFNYNLKKTKTLNNLRRRSDTIFDELKSELENAKTFLYAFNGLYLSSVEVTEEEFSNFYREIVLYFPNIQNVGWISKEPETAKMSYPISFIEPIEKYEDWIGFDFQNNKQILDTILRSQQTRIISITDKIALNEENEEGYLLISPIFKSEQLQGIVFVTLKMKEIVKKLMEKFEKDEISMFSFLGKQKKELLYAKREMSEKDISLLFDKIKKYHYFENKFDFGGREWTFLLIVEPTPKLPLLIESLSILLVGIVSMFLFTWYLINLGVLVESRTMQLRIAMKKAEEANQAKTTFLSNMSHEIRTPLTAVIGYSSMLKENILKTDNNKKLINLARKIENNGNYLIDIVNNILSISQIEVSEPPILEKEFSIVNMIRKIENLFTEKAGKKGIDFIVEEIFPFPERIIADRTHIQQVITNLCENAIKFTEKGFVKMILFVNTKEKLLHVEVHDSGIGIPENKKEEIFLPFLQADSSTARKYGGTGLGLTLSRKICQLMGGDIIVESKEQVGSTFKAHIQIKIPDNAKFYNIREELERELEREKEEENLDEGNFPQYNGKVLIAEDSMTNREVISWIVKKFNLRCDLVENGKQALNYLDHNDVDLVFLDIQMPVLDGLSTVKKLRKQGYSKPIIALTANVFNEQIANYLEAGFDDYVGKPFHVKHIHDVLHKFFSQRTTKKLINDNTEKLQQLFNKFLKTMPATIKQLNTNLSDDSKRSEIIQIFHKLRGTLLHFSELKGSSTSLHELIESLEKAEILFF